MKDWIFPLKIRNSARCLLSLLHLALCSRSKQDKKARKRNERHPDWKERSKTIYKYHDHLYRRSMESSKKLLELISDFSKVVGYPWSTYKIYKKLIVFFTLAMNSEELKLKNSTIYNSIKKEKSDIDVQKLYTENYQKLLRELEVLNKCSSGRRLNIV